MRPASPRPPPPTPILRRMRRCGWRRTYHTDSTRNSQGITRREHLCALTFETPVFGCFVWFITFFTAFLFLRKWERCKRRVAVSSSRVSHRGRVPVGVHRAQSYGFTVYRRGVARVGWSDGSLASLFPSLGVTLSWPSCACVCTQPRAPGLMRNRPQASSGWRPLPSRCRGCERR
jgi:hypothetical protein